MAQYRELWTVDEVIETLGGTNAVARAFGVTPGAVSQWRKEGLPADTFVAMSGLLMEQGMTAPSHFWGMREIV